MTGTRLIAVAVLGLAVAGGAQATTVDARQHEQARRIQAGLASGRLTPAEAARLRSEQAALRAEERFYRSTGGGLSARERADLQRDLDRASRHIERQEHDAQGR